MVFAFQLAQLQVLKTLTSKERYGVIIPRLAFKLATPFSGCSEKPVVHSVA